MLSLKDILKVAKFEEQCSRRNSPSFIPNFDSQDKPPKTIHINIRNYLTPKGDVVISHYDPILEQQGYKLL